MIITKTRTSIFGVFALFASLWLNPLLAQTMPINVNPSQLTFNAPNGTAVPQNLIVTSSSGSLNFTATAVSSANWLAVSPGNGATPQALSIAVNPGSLAQGAYAGFVNIAVGGNTTTVPVVLNLNTSGPPAITALPNSLGFNFQTANTTPQTQQLSLTPAGGLPLTYAATTAVASGGNWLSLSSNGGSAPGTLAVTVNPAVLQPGVYFGAVAINPPGTSGLIVPVQVNVAGPSTLSVSPQQLSFAYQTGTTAPAAQTLMFTSSGGTTSFSAVPSTTTCGGNWLVVSQQNSATPSTISVQINTTGLQAGNCTGSINISAPGASNPTQSIPVSLLVSNNPLLQVPTSPITFNYQIGTASPAPQTVQVTSSSTPLSFTVTATPLNNGPDFLNITPTFGTTPVGISLSLNPTVLAGLAPNTYAENVSVASPGAGNPAQTFTVTLVVSNNPTLITSQQSVNFNYQVGQATPPNQTITVTSNGAPLAYNVAATTTNCAGFLTATPASGNTGYQSGQQSQVVVGVTTTGLTTSQTCTGSVMLTVPGSTAAPVTLPVMLNVSTTPLINVSPAVINITALPGAALAKQTVSLTSTDTTVPLNFTATAATNPPGLTWLGVTPNTGSSPASLSVMVNPANLLPGVYTGMINVSSSTASVLPQTIPVTLTIASGSVSALPTTISFNQAAGGSLPGNQTVQIAGVPAGTTVGATPTFFNGNNWATVTTAGNTITVIPAGSQLTAGTYQGVITVLVPGAANSPLYVPLTYTVGGTVSNIFDVPATLSLNYEAGTTVPPPQAVPINSAQGGAIAFNAVAVAAPGTTNAMVFLTVTPSSGNTPGTLNIGLNQQAVSTLAPGMYTNLVNLTSPTAPGSTQTITVTLTVTPAGVPAVAAIVSAASYQTGPVAVGELVSIFGSNIGPSNPAFLTLTPSGSVSTTLGNVKVTFNGIAAPLTYAGLNQINAAVPWELGNATTATVVVNNNGTSSANFQVNLAPTAPSLFVATQNGSGQGAIVNQDGSLNSSTNGASAGSFIALYATGGGAETPVVASGTVTPLNSTNLPAPNLPVTVTLGGVAAQVQYAGAAPGIVSGVLQINVMIPNNVSAGNQPVVVTIGGVSSPAVVTAAVK